MGVVLVAGGPTILDDPGNWSDRIIPNGVLSESAYFFKGTIGCIPNGETPNSVPMVFMVFF